MKEKNIYIYIERELYIYGAPKQNEGIPVLVVYINTVTKSSGLH